MEPKNPNRRIAGFAWRLIWINLKEKFSFSLKNNAFFRDFSQFSILKFSKFPFHPLARLFFENSPSELLYLQN